jgi:hypothetical protein
MYYLDETWMNEVDKLSKPRTDPVGRNKMQTFLSALSADLTERTMKGRGPLMYILFADRIL